MAMPDQIVFESVMRAALDVLSTVGDAGDGIDVIQPERQLSTLSLAEAEALRLKLFAMRRFIPDNRQVGQVQ